MPTFRLVLEYDGSAFEGWQRQREGHRTVQGTLEEALARLAGGPVAVVGAGRTDAGVHAEGQVASVAFETRLDPDELRRALDAGLPGDLTVRAVAAAPEGFDARRAAQGKHYRYAVWNARARSPLRAARSHHVPMPLALEPLRAAAAALCGTHDFASFQAAGSSVRTTTRTLGRLDVEGEAGGEIRFEVEGSGFLRHMVRTLAGTLLEVGLGRRDPAGMEALLAARSRAAAGPTAPARGLTLVAVRYDESATIPGA